MDEIGRRIGAINTVRLDADGWSGINTDVPGFLEPLDGRFELAGARAAILGSGGAARGVAVALASRGAGVTVCARNADRAQWVARLVDGAIQGLPAASGSWDLLVNATSIGTYPDVDATPMPADALDGRLVYDLVYNPPVTRLLADAKAAGCETLGGLSMLVAQAECQFEWWTGDRPPAGLFRQVAERRLARLTAPSAPPGHDHEHDLV
jgi:shikimate dehydrogenase